MQEVKIRDTLVRLARSLFERGLTPGSSGNISVRLDNGGWLVTPTDASLGFLDPSRLTRLDQNGNLIAGDPPTKELPLHAALYQTRRKAGAVVHLHSTNAVAVSLLGAARADNAIPPLTPYFTMRVGPTALLPYFRPGDPAVAEAIRALSGRHAAILLANHGPVVSASTLQDAVFAAEELEETAKLMLMLQHVPHRSLTTGEVAELRQHFDCP